MASDSLAAESTRAGGDFSENRGSEPLGVKGANSTFANENTSGAVTLDATSNKESRDDFGGDYETSKIEGDYGVGGNRDITSGSGSSNTDAETGSGAGVAPSYVNSQFVDSSGPHGKNLKEGGFDSDDSKNASFNAEIGSAEDPSLRAEEKFSKENSGQAGASGMPGQGGAQDEESTGAYEALDAEREA